MTLEVYTTKELHSSLFPTQPKSAVDHYFRALASEVLDFYEKHGFAKSLAPNPRPPHWSDSWIENGWQHLVIGLLTEDVEDAEITVHASYSVGHLTHVTYEGDLDTDDHECIYTHYEFSDDECDSPDVEDYDQVCWTSFIDFRADQLSLPTLVHELIHFAQRQFSLELKSYSGDDLIPYYDRLHEQEAYCMTPAILEHLKKNRKDLVSQSRKLGISINKKLAGCGFMPIYSLAETITAHKKLADHPWSVYAEIRDPLKKGDLSAVHHFISTPKDTPHGNENPQQSLSV